MVKEATRQRGSCQLVIGRDARKSGPMVSGLIIPRCASMGINVTDLGLATTPTVEMAVSGSAADGGIIVTASHNPAEWNALKLLNENGEFLSSDDGLAVLRLLNRRILSLLKANRQVH